MVSKTEKAQLVQIEKCERAAGRFKIEERLNNERRKIEEPFDERLTKIQKSKEAALLDAKLYYISSGCGRTHPELEKYDLETNRRIKAILRE